MEKKKIKDLYFFHPKSKIKAGDGLEKGSYPFYTSSAEQTKWLNTHEFNTRALILGTGGKASLHFANGAFSVSTDCFALSSKQQELEIRYSYYYLISKFYIIERGFKGAGLKHISKEYVENIEIEFPDLETQNKIVAILDKAKAILDKREQTIKKYDELLRAVFLEMFGDPVKNEKGFQVGKIREVAQEVKYGTSKPAEIEGKYPYLRMNNISFEGYMDYTDLKYINIEEKEKEKYIVENGDLLFNRTNSKELVGKTGIFDRDEKMVIAGYLIRVRTNELANTYYLWAYLNSKHGKQTLFSMCKNIVGMANINAQELQDIKILIPPIELQNRYKNIFLKIQNSLKKLKSSRLELVELNAALSKLAFAGKLKFNTAVDLEVLLENDYEFFKENSSIKSIQLLLERLDTNELNENRFSEQQTYDKAKSFVFELLKDGKIKQVFDEQAKKVKLTVT